MRAPDLDSPVLAIRKWVRLDAIMTSATIWHALTPMKYNTHMYPSAGDHGLYRKDENTHFTRAPSKVVHHHIHQIPEAHGPLGQMDGPHSAL